MMDQNVAMPDCHRRSKAHDMPAKSKKRKIMSKRVPVATQKSLVEWGKKADASNLERGFTLFACRVNDKDLGLLPAIFLVRGRVLRALSQGPRKYLDDRDVPDLYYKPVVEAQLCKFDGLSANPNLASYIGTVRVILTSYQSTVILQKLVTEVWCNYKVWFEEDGSELVTAITEHCKEVQEMHGFSLADENLVKRIITAAPNLRVLELYNRNFRPIVDALSSFKYIDTIIINWPWTREGYDRSEADLQVHRCAEAIKQRFKDFGRRYFRIRQWHKSNGSDFQLGYLGSRVSHRGETDINTYVRDYYSEVPI